MISRAKSILKQCSILVRINAALKSTIFKIQLSKLRSYYRAKIDSLAYKYSEELAIRSFKISYNQNFKAKNPETGKNSCVVWVGASKSQDYSGFIQALSKLFDVEILSNHLTKYGLLLEGECPSIKLNEMQMRQINDDMLVDGICEISRNKEVLFVIGQFWRFAISDAALSQVRSHNVPIINISMDDRLPSLWNKVSGIRRGSVGLLPHLDLVLTTTPEVCAWYGVMGCPALYFPLASDPSLFEGSPNSDRPIDVLFIGNKYGIREKLVNVLVSKGIKVECFGKGWPNGFADSIKMSDLSKSAKIILGIGTVAHCKNVYTLKLRDFDSMLSGALYITHRNPDLCKIFQEDIDFVCYENISEAANKINLYLENEQLRRKIALSGQIKAKKYHNWDYRLNQVFSKIGFI